MGSVPCQGEGSSPSRVSSLCLIPHIPTSPVMAVGHAWRRPRMKVYDYNQEFGGNYYQPMIQYINHKNIYGPFSRKADVYLPHGAEVTSAKYTNMRYNDKSSAKHNLDQFLVDAHKTQIKELNGTTAAVHHRALHGSRGPSVFTDRHLKGNHVASERERNHYRRELMLLRAKELDKEEEEAALVRPSLLQEIRSRNRVDAIRRSARAELADEPDWLMEAGPTVDPVFLRPSPPPSLDPLPFELRCRLDSARAAFDSLSY